MNNIPIETYESVVQQRDALAAENVALKYLSIKLFNLGYLKGHESTVEGYFIDIHRNDIGTYHNDDVAEIIEDEVETPATDAFTRELMAKGADLCVKTLVSSDDDDFTDAPNICSMMAYQLRKGINDAQ